MSDTKVIIVSIALIGFGFSLMVIRDYRLMRRATLKNKNLDKFLQDLDSHDPTPYDKLIEKHNIPVGVDKDKAHLFDGDVKILNKGDKHE